MRLVNLASEGLTIGPCVVGLGSFDGLHLGHRAIIEALRKRAAALKLPAVIFTFDHPPKSVLSPKTFPGEITSSDEKFDLLLNTGVDWVVYHPFDEAFARTTPKEFLQKMVAGQLQAKSVFVGFNFGFGLKREGNVQYLSQELAALGVEAHVLPSVNFEGITVSSTMTRQAITDGNISLANQLLGREFSFSGAVVHGDHRGRKMGFPTANLDLEKTTKVIPARGVYFGTVETMKGRFFALINIGVRPTFDRKILLLEAHLLNFQDDIYHQTIQVRYLQRIRDEIRFSGMEELITQIRTDLEQAKGLVEGFLKKTSARSDV